MRQRQLRVWVECSRLVTTFLNCKKDAKAGRAGEAQLYAEVLATLCLSQPWLLQQLFIATERQIGMQAHVKCLVYKSGL